MQLRKTLFSVWHRNCGGGGETRFKHSFKERSVLSALLKGSAVIYYGINQQMTLTAGHLFLIPANVTFEYEVLDDIEVMYCTLTPHMQMCTHHSMVQLESFRPSCTRKELYYIKMDERICEFFRLLRNCMSDGLRCLHYQQMKREELFLYLRAGYSKEELALFFYPLLGKDIDFKDFVLSNYKDVHDVKEFAARANMSVSTFSRHFKDTFKETALHWMLDRKAESVLNDIVKSNLSFAEIANKYSFSSPSYFVSFCKNRFGKTAAELRKGYFDEKP